MFYSFRLFMSLFPLQLETYTNKDNIQNGMAEFNINELNIKHFKSPLTVTYYIHPYIHLLHLDPFSHLSHLLFPSIPPYVFLLHAWDIPCGQC